MGSKTGITWTDSTWNPIRGCSKVSAGCDNCYAMSVAHRFSGPGQAYAGLSKITNGRPNWTGVVRVVADELYKRPAPLRWQEPRRIFVNSMSDLFHEQLERKTIIDIFAVMALAPTHRFQVLTKRPDRMQALLDDADMGMEVWLAARTRAYELGWPFDRWPDPVTSGAPWPLPNVWLGTSIEHQQAAAHRLPLLLATPAAVRFVSVEPLLEQVDLVEVGFGLNPGPAWSRNPLEGLHWVIVGGESGARARPMDPDWVRLVRDDCRRWGVAFFFKQAGAVLGHEWGCRDSHGADPGEWPAEFQIQQYPEGEPA